MRFRRSCGWRSARPRCWQECMPQIRAQSGATQTAQAPVAADSQSPSSTQQAYTLPPDKLAKAIATQPHPQHSEHCRVGLGPCFSVAAAGDADLGRAWRAGQRRFRAGAGFRELFFFAAYLIIATLAGLPLDWIGEHYERSYGISVQGWGSWIGDEGKSLGLTLAVRRAGAAALQLDRAALAAALLARRLGGHAADSGVSHFY